MRIRLLFPLALTALAAAAFAFPAVGGAIKIPKGVKAAKVNQYPVTIDAVGYLDHTWTWDSTNPCLPGYAKTIDESLTFELGRPRSAKVSIVNGKVILYPVISGEATLQTELSNWRTTNYCPPLEPRTEPPEPVCTKKLRGKVGIGITPVKEEVAADDDPAPLVHPTQVTVFRAKATPQQASCQTNRPRIEAESEDEKGWHADPQVGLLAPLGATEWQFIKLKVGETLRRTVQISGGCGKASFAAGASIADEIRSCVVKGKVVVIVKRTGKGISSYQ